MTIRQIATDDHQHGRHLHLATAPIASKPAPTLRWLPDPDSIQNITIRARARKIQRTARIITTIILGISLAASLWLGAVILTYIWS